MSDSAGVARDRVALLGTVMVGLVAGFTAAVVWPRPWKAKSDEPDGEGRG